jgi:DNA-binding CsgD family transcriptional regulator
VRSHPDPVGRESVLDDAMRFLDALAGGPAALLVEGHAGIGKTTVCRATTLAAAEREYRVLSTTPVDGEADLPFVALRDLLEPVPVDAGQALPAPQRDALDIALLRSSQPGAMADQHAVCAAALSVIRSLAAQGPLLIAVDDVGWLDRSSDRVLRYVIRRLTTEPVGILAARRPAVDPAVPLGLDGPPVGSRLGRVELGPLEPEALHVLITERYGLSLPRRATWRIHDICSGNPFAAVEIARAVQRSGGRGVPPDVALPLPNGVLAVCAERIASLGTPARRALAVVATAATPTVALLETAVGEQAHDGLEEAVAEGLLEVTDQAVRFAHPLLRSAAAANMSARGRRSLHRELAALVADPDERAVHMAAGAIGPDERIAVALDDAATRACDRGAPDTAAVLAARAVALTPPDLTDSVARRRIWTAEYQYRAEDVEAARVGLTEVIAALPAGELRAEALVWLANVRQAQNGMAEVVELSRQALAEAGDALLKAAAERDLALALVINGDVRGGDRHAEAALATARTTGDRVSIAESEAALAWTQFWFGRGLRTDLLDSARAYPRYTRYAPHEASPNVIAGLLLSWADELDDARAALLAENARLTQLGEDRPRAVVLFTLAELECRAGNWDAALRHAEQGMAMAVLAGDEFYRALLLYAHGLVQAHRGRLDDARADAEQAIATGTALGAAVAVRFAVTLLGFVELSAGDHDAVHRRLAPLAAQVPPDGGFDPGLARFLPDEVEALVALGDNAAAGALLAPFEAQAAALDRPWALGAAGRCRAQLMAAAEDTDGALLAIAAAINAHDRVDMPFERARTLLVAGSVRRRARRRREARETLESALAEFDRLGAVAWAQKAQSEIHRIGGRAPAGRELTEAEDRIAELVAGGRTNREVAAALFLTVGTVEAALSKIYRKLDVRSRTELAAKITNRARSRP